MWSRWWCAGGGVGSLRQRLSAIVNISHGYGGRLHPLVPPFLGLKDIAVEFGGRRGGISSLSVGFNEFKTGISSSTLVSSPADSNGNSNASENGGNDKSSEMSYSETKKLMKLVNVESLKMKLCSEGKEFISYSELLQVCEKMGVTRTPDETSAFVNVLDEAGVILLFRDKVYLHPSKVADLVRKAVPLALTSEDDSMREEYKKLLAKKEEIDSLAHKQVRRILWCGLGLSLMQVGLFFRLTFWEFSWDVMEPIAFFVTSSGLIIGYAYFLFTSRDPTYQDFMKRLFNSRQKKLFKRYSFDIERFIELQKKFSTTLSVRSILKNHAGMELELEDALRKY